MNESSDPRARGAREWAHSQWSVRNPQWATASADASFRRYFRLQSGAESRIVMDAPPAQEDCRPFVRIARLLAAWGLNVPQVLAEDYEQGFLLLSDLGTQTVLDVLTPDNADAQLGLAMDALIRMQSMAMARPSEWSFLPAYDADLLWHELRLFQDWYLPRHLGIELSKDDRRELELAQEPLVRSALAQPKTFVHRDYMPRNLMVGAPGPGILDFQDAVAGPISYDPVCLFRDAFHSWPVERVEGWLRQYWQQGRAAGLPLPDDLARFRKQADWMGLHRHLKVLGIFARLSYRDGKAKYVADTPRFVRYVMDVAPHHPELRALAGFFERHVLPRVPL